MLVRTEAWVKLKDLHLPEAWGSDYSLKDLLVLQHPKIAEVKQIYLPHIYMECIYRQRAFQKSLQICNV